MSIDVTSERVCYVHCNFCNTILAVSVPCSSMCTLVTVRCGHCSNLLSVNMGALLQTLPLQDLNHQKQQSNNIEHGSNKEGTNASSSSKSNKFSLYKSPPQLPPIDHEPPRISHIRPPEKRQRVPSAYNRFIKEEIQRIKNGNPEISHREAFSTAAKNWAHFPNIHFGLKLEASKQMKLDNAVRGEGAQKSNAFY